MLHTGPGKTDWTGKTEHPAASTKQIIAHRNKEKLTDINTVKTRNNDLILNNLIIIASSVIRGTVLFVKSSVIDITAM